MKVLILSILILVGCSRNSDHHKNCENITYYDPYTTDIMEQRNCQCIGWACKYQSQFRRGPRGFTFRCSMGIKRFYIPYFQHEVM